MNMQNLAKLIAQLKTEESGKNFNMGDWVRVNDPRLCQEHDIVDLGELIHNPDLVPKVNFCNTAACIGGTALLMEMQNGLDIRKFEQGDFTVHDKLIEWFAEWLGISHRDSMYVVLGLWSRKSLSKITVSSAIRYLECVQANETVWVGGSVLYTGEF